MTDPHSRPVGTSAAQDAHIVRVGLMLLARALEQRAIAIAERDPAITPVPSARGSEALGVGAASALRPGDRLFSPDRFLSAHLARGLEPEDFIARCLGGRGRAHADREPGSLGWTSTGTELIDLAAGAALALRLRDAGELVAMALVPGEAYASGQCNRAMRAAATRGLALVLVVEAPPGLQATGPTHEVADLAEVEDVASAASDAVAAARSGDGPQTVVCRRPRLDDGVLAELGGTDPVARELYRLAGNPATRSLVGSLRREVAGAVDAAAAGVDGLTFRREGALASA